MNIINKTCKNLLRAGLIAFLFFSGSFSGANAADIASVLYVADAINSKEDSTNKVVSATGLTVTSTDVEYPSAKTVYDVLVTKVGLTGDETVAGNKTFSGDVVITGSMVVPTMPLP